MPQTSRRIGWWNPSARPRRAVVAAAFTAALAGALLSGHLIARRPECGNCAAVSCPGSGDGPGFSPAQGAPGRCRRKGHCGLRRAPRPRSDKPPEFLAEHISRLLYADTLITEQPERIDGFDAEVESLRAALAEANRAAA